MVLLVGVTLIVPPEVWVIAVSPFPLIDFVFPSKLTTAVIPLAIWCIIVIFTSVDAVSGISISTGCLNLNVPVCAPAIALVPPEESVIVIW